MLCAYGGTGHPDRGFPFEDRAFVDFSAVLLVPLARPAALCNNADRTAGVQVTSRRRVGLSGPRSPTNRARASC